MEVKFSKKNINTMSYFCFHFQYRERKRYFLTNYIIWKWKEKEKVSKFSVMNLLLQKSVLLTRDRNLILGPNTGAVNKKTWKMYILNTTLNYAFVLFTYRPKTGNQPRAQSAYMTVSDFFLVFFHVNSNPTIEL